MRQLLAIAAFVSVATTVAIAATLAPSAIVANPSNFDGKTVTVSGKVANFQTSSTLMGKVAGYQLCDGKCVVVIDEKNHAQINGGQATVTGTFHVTFKGPRKTFTNAIVISK